MDVAEQGLRVPVRVRPSASRTRVGGSYGTDGVDGTGARLVVAVTARPVDGAANAAVERAVAAAFGVAPRAVRLVSGATGRSKVLFVAGEQAGLYARLSELLAD